VLIRLPLHQQDRGHSQHHRARHPLGHSSDGTQPWMPARAHRSYRSLAGSDGESIGISAGGVISRFISTTKVNESQPGGPPPRS
jgi:hypothetical protein